MDRRSAVLSPTSRFRSRDSIRWLQQIQRFFPLPNQPGIINNYLAPAYQNWLHTTNWSFKLDHSISPTIKLGWYFSRLESNSPNANGVTQPYNAPNPTANRNVTTRVNYDQTITPTLLLHIGMGYIQQYQPTDYPNFDQSSLGMHGLFPDQPLPLHRRILRRQPPSENAQA